jgi:putative SOS response-associated peptidase YedK
MCGRFTLHSRDRIRLKGLATLDLPFEARYNIAPSQSVLSLGDFGRGLEARFLTWGLIPSWSTDGKGFINARAETLDEKPSFSDSFRLRRCLIPADGFFEWKRTGREKRPFYFQVADEKPFAFAGIWDTWSNRGDVVPSCAIITTAANELVGELHDRMPAILLDEFHDAWLDPHTKMDSLKQLLSPFPASRMCSHPVSNAVNHPNNDREDLIARVDYESGVTLSLF